MWAASLSYTGRSPQNFFFSKILHNSTSVCPTDVHVHLSITILYSGAYGDTKQR